jgi:hypothetical protein
MPNHRFVPSPSFALNGAPYVDDATMLAISAVNAQDQSQTLYLTEPNTLVVTIDTASAAIDTNASLLLLFDSKLPVTTWENASPSAPGFNFILVQDKHVYQWKIEPQATLPTQLDPQVVVTFSGLTPPDGSPATTKIILSWEGLKDIPDGNRSQRLSIGAPPTTSAALELTYAWIAPDQPVQSRDVSEVQPVWVSTGEANAISNRIAFMISNTSDTPVVASGDTGHPAFYLSFDTVVNKDDPGNFDALCTLDEVLQMTATLETDGLTTWSISPQANLDGRWPLLPPDEVLGGRQSLTVTFDHLETYLPPFVTTLYIDWENVPGYCNGTATLPLQKKPASPTIVDFHADPSDNLTAGQEVTLTWNTYGNRRTGPVRICLRDQPNVSVAENQPAVGSFKAYPTAPTAYRLQLVDAQPTVVESDCSANVLPVTVSLTVGSTGTYYYGSAVTFTATLQYAQSYSLTLQYDMRGGFHGGVPIIPCTTLGGSTTVTQPTSLMPPQPSYSADSQLSCIMTATGYQGPQSTTLAFEVKALPFFVNSGPHQVGGDIQKSDTWYRLPAGVGMILLNPAGCDPLLGAFNIHLFDQEGTPQGTPVPVVFDCNDTEGKIIFTVCQTSAVLNYDSQSYDLQTLALLPPLTVDDNSGNASFPQAVGFVNSGPNPIYLNWVDCSHNDMRNVLITSFTPQIGSSVWCYYDAGTPFLACGWNFTGYKILC